MTKNKHWVGDNSLLGKFYLFIFMLYWFSHLFISEKDDEQ